jgi:hypothetical protein
VRCGSSDRERIAALPASGKGRDAWREARYLETAAAPVFIFTLMALVVAPLDPASNCTLQANGSMVEVSVAGLYVMNPIMYAVGVPLAPLTANAFV